MFVNDLKMGKAGRGVAWLIGAIAMTAALMALGMRVDLGVGMTAVNVALALGARALGRSPPRSLTENLPRCRTRRFRRVVQVPVYSLRCQSWHCSWH